MNHSDLPFHMPSLQKEIQQVRCKHCLPQTEPLLGRTPCRLLLSTTPLPQLCVRVKNASYAAGLVKSHYRLWPLAVAGPIHTQAKPQERALKLQRL